MSNALTYSDNFAHVISAKPSGVDLGYTLDRDLWPWLALPPAHPVLVEKYQYFGAMTASWEMKVFQPETFTALTRFQWRCLPAAFAGLYGERGRCEPWTRDKAMGFKLDICTADGQPLYETSGEGVAFQDRDFKAWRERSRQRALAESVELAGSALEPECLGLGLSGQGFLARVADAPESQLWANVPTVDGFFPRHRFHTGSGDHVTAAQLMDCGLQAAHYFLANAEAWPQPLQCVGGEVRFARYVELDVPFLIEELTRREAEGRVQIELRFSQAGRDNVWLALQLSEQVPA